MELFVTVFDLDAIRSLDADHDGIEMRVDRHGDVDLHALRAATSKPIILTNRGGPTPDIARAIAAGIDFVDVEWREGMTIDGPRERIVLSHHDYEGTPDVDAVLRAMKAHGCAHAKLAATPKSWRDNQRLLEATDGSVTVIGMGERGLYSRIAAPFFGSRLAFVTPDEASSAAPGMITLDRALAIYGSDRRSLRADALFAIVGNPAGHSLSPAIHNPLFREHGVPAAYTILSTDDFDDVIRPFAAGEPFAPRGLSITAPFKELAYAFAVQSGWRVGENAQACGAANTLIVAPRPAKRGEGGRRPGEGLADNTDVDGFRALLSEVCGRDQKSVALIGAGGTAKAALVALRGMHVTIFNRTQRENTRPLHELQSFDGEIIVNTLPGNVEIDLSLKPGMTYIEAAYGRPRLATRDAQLAGVQYLSGLDLIHAQAIRQNQLFREAMHGL